MSSLPAWAGTLPGWLTALASTGGFVAWLKYLVDKKRIEGDRLAGLEKENRQLRKDFDDYREKCVKETDALHELVKGLRSQMHHLELRELEWMRGNAPPATAAQFLGGLGTVDNPLKTEVVNTLDDPVPTTMTDKGEKT